MTATAGTSNRHPRLYVEQPLAVGNRVVFTGAQAHYLANVMRIKPGDALVLFDDLTGEYLAQIGEANKRQVALDVLRQMRPREAVPDLWLVAAPIKRQRFDWVAQKACELGVARLVPVLTARTVVHKVNAGRLRAHMIEAAEQCERTALPRLGPLEKLDALLADWPSERTLFFADERAHESDSRASFRAALRAHDGPAAILIGPEGGFTDEEKAAIRACPQAVAVALGPRILRADTAAVAAIAIWMAGRGDW